MDMVICVLIGVGIRVREDDIQDFLPIPENQVPELGMLFCEW